MKKVYIVTAGEYEDYSIIAVFSTEQRAKNYIEKYNLDAEIEDWPVVASSIWAHLGRLRQLAQRESRRKPRRVYEISLRENGEVEKVWSEVSDEPVDDEVHRNWYGIYWTHIKTESEERAIKIARERLKEKRGRVE